MDSIPTTFPQFRYLAPELRLKIFSYIIPTPHVVSLSVLYTTTLGFVVHFDHDARANLSLITPVLARGLTHTCRDLRKVYLAAFPDTLTLSSGGTIHLNYRTTIIYLQNLDRLISAPTIGKVLFDRVTRSSPLQTPPLVFPDWFTRITHLALPIDCITEYPETSPYTFDQTSGFTEIAFLGKMLRPFKALRHLWAVADRYWLLDIYLTAHGFFQPYPGETDVSVLGKLAERKEQLALWATYRNCILERARGGNVSDELVFMEPDLAIWGMTHLELWDHLCE